jgi:hypothetical protein
VKQSVGGAAAIVWAPVPLIIWFGLAGFCLKYLQHAFGFHPFSPDWLNFLIGGLIPPVVPIGIVIFTFNGVGHFLFHTSM